VSAVRIATLAAVLAWVTLDVAAQAYPSKPIRFVSPQPPGGTFDLVIRVFSEQLQPALGQPLVIEHRPGAGTVIALEHTARQPPDGYTIIMTASTHTILPSLHAKLPFDPVKSFSPVSLVAVSPFILVVRSDSPARTVADYVAMAKAKPGAVTFGSSGVGTPLHFSGEMMKAMTGVDMLHVPYKGAAAVITAVLAGEITSSFAPAAVALPQIRAGKLRALGNVGSVRTSTMPDLPNIGETIPGFSLDSWFGVLGPAGLPRPIVERLNAEFNRAAKDPAFIRDKLAPNGVDPAGTTPERLQEQMVADIAKYARIVKQAGIKPE
jgi:tripartite-type tricarboxylate transporter receptor subunit TctC